MLKNTSSIVISVDSSKEWVETVKTENKNHIQEATNFTFSRPGNVLLSHALRQSTIGAGALNVRVRNGIVCYLSAKTTRSTKREINTK